MLTNHLANRDKLMHYIESGTLFTHESENGLLILTDRGTHYLMHFYLKSTALHEELPSVDKPIVTEIAKRDDDSSFDSIEQMLAGCGFTRILRRRRFVKSKFETPPDDLPCNFASIKDFTEIRSLLAASFSPLTGCIPDDKELTDAIAASQISVIRDNSEIAALLHFRKEKRIREIRHLCVSESHRGHGLASLLVKKISDLDENGNKTLVWVSEGYREAETVYEKNGFTPDGMISDVFIK